MDTAKSNYDQMNEGLKDKTTIARMKEAASWYRDAFDLPKSHTEEAGMALFLVWLKQQGLIIFTSDQACRCGHHNCPACNPLNIPPTVEKIGR